MKIEWRRTHIGGEDLHHDFVAYVDGNINIARILREKDANGNLVWSANVTLFGVPTNEIRQTREDAVRFVEDALAQYLASERGKDDPQMWVQDQRSAQLRYLRERDPERFAELIEELRRGHPRI